MDTPEGVMKTDAAGFQKYLEDKQRKKLQAPKPPEATPVVTAPETEQLASPTSATILTEPFVATQTLPASPPPPVSIDFSTMVEFVENDPSQFVAHLTELVANGDQQAITILGLLKSSTADELIATLQPYKVAGYQEPIEILEKNKEWLEQVIALLKAEEKHDG